MNLSADLWVINLWLYLKYVCQDLFPLFSESIKLAEGKYLLSTAYHIKIKHLMVYNVFVIVTNNSQFSAIHLVKTYYN